MASATAQEAHEAIRPSIMTEGGRFRTPKEMTAGWIADMKKLDLYTLIYERTLASVMKDAKMERKTVGVEARNEGGKEGGAPLQAELVLTGQTILTHGFLRALREDQQQQQAPSSSSSSSSLSGDADSGPPPSLPASSLGLLTPGQPLTCTGTKVLPHSTSPPHRFTQGSFVRTVEELGIGRPSTYATIIEVLKTRRYVPFSTPPSLPPSLLLLRIASHKGRLSARWKRWALAVLPPTLLLSRFSRRAGAFYVLRLAPSLAPSLLPSLPRFGLISLAGLKNHQTIKPSLPPSLPPSLLRYFAMKGNGMVPTLLGFVVAQLLERHFPDFVDASFTSRMEGQLDAIAKGSVDRVTYLDEYYKGLTSAIELVVDTIDR